MTNKDTAKTADMFPTPENMYGVFLVNTNGEHTLTKKFSSQEEAEKYVKRTLIEESTLSDKGKIDICVEHGDQAFKLCSIYVDMTKNKTMGRIKKTTCH